MNPRLGALLAPAKALDGLRPHHAEGAQLGNLKKGFRSHGEAELKRRCRALRFHAKAYIHGHRVGGTNPSLVESLAAGSATIAHDNRFTRWVAGEEAKFFTGPEDLEEIVCSLEKEPKLLEEMEAGSRQRFEKDLVKDRVLAAYEELLLRVSRCYRKGPPDSGAAWLPRFMRRRYTARRNRWDDGDAKE